MSTAIPRAASAGVPRLRVILIEHADMNEDWHRDACVERWRGGRKLVPEDSKREGEGAAE